VERMEARRIRNEKKRCRGVDRLRYEVETGTQSRKTDVSLASEHQLCNVYRPTHFTFKSRLRLDVETPSRTSQLT
jgi:hypothetical protein